MKHLVLKLYNVISESLYDGLSDAKKALSALASILIILLIIPAIPFILIYLHFDNIKFQKNYRLYLKNMNGACFFCYNSRKSSVQFAREIIVSKIDSTVRVIFVDGWKIDCGPDSKYISKMLGDIKEKKGFPYLLKIIDEQVAYSSVNNQFYSIMIGSKPIAPLLHRISDFYNSTIIARPN